MLCKKNNLLFIALAVLSLIANPLLAKFAKTARFADFFAACEGFSTNSLVILDVDQVIIEPRDAIMRPQNQNLLWELRFAYGGHLTASRHAELSSHVSLQETSILIDPDALAFIEHIQKQNIPIIALTATGVTGFGKIPSIPDWRVADLKRLGISFATSFSHHPVFTLTQIQGNTPSPVFKNGILFTGGYSKGDVLTAFLHTVEFCPDKVFFADDLLHNLQSVEAALTKKGVKEIHTFQYLGADTPNTIDLDVAHHQIRTLMQQEKWLSDLEAKAALTR
ncbi:MAG: DUF2608 domain-containing protein [Chlamydiales bacterium]|nr:DUF2608 domain-containing protein [Chlamydiales bacterium]